MNRHKCKRCLDPTSKHRHKETCKNKNPRRGHPGLPCAKCAGRGRQHYVSCPNNSHKRGQPGKPCPKCNGTGPSHKRGCPNVGPKRKSSPRKNPMEAVDTHLFLRDKADQYLKLETFLRLNLDGTFWIPQ